MLCLEVRASGYNFMSESFAELLEDSLASQNIKQGQILTATVVDVNPDVVIVNAGLKSEAVIPTVQFLNERGKLEVEVGDEIEVALDAVEDGFGETRLSREKAKRMRTWIVLQEAFDESKIAISKLEDIDYTMEQSQEGNKNFTVIKCKIKSIEWMYLAAKGHRRARFEVDNNKEYWLVP